MPTAAVAAVLAITLAIAGLVVAKPDVTVGRAGKILAFLGLFILPVFAGLLGLGNHIERSKQTQFCLSCHIMEPYGRSLRVDDKSFIPAAHFQNNRVPRDEACYTCHTDYTLYTGVSKPKFGACVVSTPSSSAHRTSRSSSISRSITANACIAIWAHAASKRKRPTALSWTISRATNFPACLPAAMTQSTTSPN